MFRIRRNKKQNLADRLSPYTYKSETESTTVIAKYMHAISRPILALLHH